jgi:hypothetical protein
MNISEAQRENRFRFYGGFYGQLVSGVLWLLSACLAVTVGVKCAIFVIVLGGFLIFPATESFVRLSGRQKLSADNTLWSLGMQVAFVLPFSMLLLVPVTQYRTNLFASKYNIYENHTKSNPDRIPYHPGVDEHFLCLGSRR